MIAIFQSEQDAALFDSAVCEAMGWPSDDTLRYGVPVKHQTLERWAMPVLEYAAPYVPASATLVESLPDDWLPPPSMP